MNTPKFFRATKLALLFAVTTLCVSQISFSQTFVDRHGRLQAQGNRILDKNGEVVSLAGNSLFWSIAGDISDFYNADTVEHIATNWNSSIIRAAMGVNESWDGGRGYVDNPELQTAKISRVVDAAIDQGIYVIIDWHSHDAENYTNEAVTFFTEMARRYGNTPNVIYEIYNEPINQSWTTIKNYAETVIEAIRAEDPDNLIVVGTGFYSQEVDEASQDPINDNNVAYTLHFYAATHKQELRNRALTALSNGVPLFVTEWGAVEASGDGAIDYAETNRWMEFMKENGISHACWSLSDKPNNNNPNVLEGSAIVELRGGVQALQADRLSDYGVLVKDIILNWTDFQSSTGNNGPVQSSMILDFDTRTTEITEFNGITTAVITNPQTNGINAEATNVLEVSNSGIEDYEGFATGIIPLIDFGPNSTKTILVDVYSTTAVTVDLQIKAVDEEGNVIDTPRGASKAVGHSGQGWEQMEFNFTSRANKSYDGFDDDGEENFIPEGLFSQLAMLIDPGAPAANGAATYYVDNFRLKTGEGDGGTDPNPDPDPEPNPTNEAPTVSVTAPENNATVTLGETVTISATASDDVAVTNVDFQVNGVLLTRDTTAPYTTTFTATEAGEYTLTAIAVDEEEASTEATVTITVEAANTGGNNPTGCQFNTPSEESLPTFDNITFNNIYSLGSEGPDVSNITSFSINWNAGQNGLYQFALNTSNGVPDYYVNLLENINYSFNTTNPEVTLTNTGLAGWDGAYWVTSDEGNFVMASKESDFTLYFSNNEVAPECSPETPSLSTDSFFGQERISVVLYPNPAVNSINIDGIKADSTIKIVDIQGRTVVNTNVTVQESNIDISLLAKGVYFLKLNSNNAQKTITFIKK